MLSWCNVHHSTTCTYRKSTWKTCLFLNCDKQFLKKNTKERKFKPKVHKTVFSKRKRRSVLKYYIAPQKHRTVRCLCSSTATELLDMGVVQVQSYPITIYPKRQYLHKPRSDGTICSEENSATNGYSNTNQQNYNHQRREWDSANHSFGEQK